MAPNAWDPTDDPDTPLFTITQGQPVDQNVSGNFPRLAGGDLPDNHLALIHGIELMIGDFTDNEFNPGDYAELWLYFGHGNADVHHLGRWPDKLVDDDFMAHFRWGYLGIEDTVSGTGGTSAVKSPPSSWWIPQAPVVSATGEISANWEGDGDEPAAQKGEFALRVWWTSQEVSDQEFFKQLLRDR